LNQRGWETSVDGLGGWGVVSDVPNDQQPIYNADYESCLEDLGLDDFTVTEETAIASYKNNVRVTECLADAQYSIPENPSQAAFVTATLQDPNEEIWNPYSLVPPDDLWKAVTACPQ
jgi:hypothetical protein